MVLGLAVTIALGIAAGVFTGVVISYIILKIIELIQWFRKRSTIREENAKAIAFSIGGMIKDGKFKKVSGVFNENTNKYNLIQGFYDLEKDKVIEFRPIESDDIDDEIRKNHYDEEIVIYE